MATYLNLWLDQRNHDQNMLNIITENSYELWTQILQINQWNILLDVIHLALYIGIDLHKV